MANKRLNAVITIGGAVAGSLRGAFGAVTSETQKVGAAVQRLTERQRELNAQLARFGRDGSNAASMRVFYANQELATIGRQVALLRQRESLERARAANQARRSELGGRIGSTVATGAAVALPVGMAIKEAAEFDYELQLIGNTARKGADAIAAMRRDVLAISRESGQSAANVRKGLGVLVSSGMEDMDTARPLLADIGTTATAMKADVEDLAKTVFTLNDTLRITPQNMRAALDTLATAGQEGKFELRDMAKHLPTLAAGFGALKMQGREAAATIGAALQVAMKGAGDPDQAANNMKNFIQKVLSPETRKKALKNFNLDLAKLAKNAQAKGQNVHDVLMEAILKATKGDQIALGEMFQDMQVQDYIRPMMQFWGEYQRIKGKALAGDGVIAHDFETIAQTTQHKLNQLSASFGRLGIAMGAIFSGGAGEKSQGLSVRIGQLAEFIEEHRTLVRVGVQVVGGLVAMRLAVLGTAYAWNLATGAAIAMRGVWLGMAGAGALAAGATGWMRVGMAIRFVGTSLLWVGRAMLLNPIGLAVTAIAGAAFLVIKYWEPIKTFFAGVWDSVKATFTSVYDWIVGKIAWLIEAPGKVAAKVREFIGRGAAGDSGGGYDAMGNPTGGGLPEVPAMASRGGATVMDNSTNSYTIVQQPGQDARALADELERRRRQQAGVRARSSLVDGMGAQ